MPFFIPCRCPTGIGEYAVWGSYPPSATALTRSKYGFDSQQTASGAVFGAAGFPNQAGRGPVSSYLAFLLGGGNGDVEAYNRTTDVRTVTVSAWGATPGNSGNTAGPLTITQSSMFHRNSGFTYFPTEVTWATTTYNTLGSFLPGATFAANGSGCVYKNDQAHLAGEGSTNSNTKWLYDRQLGSFNVNGTILQSGTGFLSLSGITNGYYIGGTNGAVALSFVLRLVYQTGVSVYTTPLANGRAQAVACQNSAQTLGVLFTGTLNNPGNIGVDQQTIRFNFATEVNAYSSILFPAAGFIAGA